MREKTREYLASLLPHDSEYVRFADLLDYKNEAEREEFPVIDNDVLQFIRVLIKSTGAKSLLEIGTAVGASAMLFSSYMGEGSRVVTIEREAANYERACANIARCGYSERIEPIFGEAEELLSAMNDSFDLIFLDGAKGHYIYMLDDCVRLLAPRGLLIADNVLFRGMVAGAEPLWRRKITIVKRLRKFLTAINSREDIISSTLPIGDGVSVSVKLPQ